MLETMEKTPLSPKDILKEHLRSYNPDYRYYKSIFHLTSGMIAITDGYHIIDANKAFADYFLTLKIDVFDPQFDFSSQLLRIDKYGYVYEGYLERPWFEHVLSGEKGHYKGGISGKYDIQTFSIGLTRLDEEACAYVLILSDVTDMMSYKCMLEEGIRSRTQEKEESEHRFRQYDTAIDASNLLARCDLDGNILYVNDALSTLLGYSSDELVSSNVSILFESDSEIICRQNTRTLLESGKIWKGVMKNIGKYGTHHYFATTIVPITDMKGSSVEILSIRHDITETVQAKEEALHLLEAKTKFFDQVSHELRTPLNAIVNFTDQALETYDEIVDDDVSRQLVKRYIERTYANAEHLLALINSLLDIAKIKSGKTRFDLHPYNAVTLAREAYENCTSLHKNPNLLYTFESSGSKIDIICDSVKFKQMLINLISNALKFTMDGFVIVRVVLDGKKCQVEVEDSGMGIPSDKLGSIFEPFEQVRDHGFGTGLGLNIVREYAQAMGMKIDVSSIEGTGSTFRISINAIL
ncbi:PAS domain-containing sensor histidine kinase [Sulfuricurvum sp.]|uniref:PAS domain-containing sensor histidine kinase n=1 Tax=Sulfuricurvum sp. TaxID=2025608 RepID=UPI003BB4E2AA